MKSDRLVPVAIIGAGFSGTMVAANLARRGVDSLLIEPTERAGRGTAFSTPEVVHLLNVPAGNMSAWPDDPEDFANRAGVDGKDFAERRHFGSYLRTILDDAIAAGRTELVQGLAVAALREGDQWRIHLDSGEAIAAKALVIAIGNQPPAPLPFAGAGSDRVIANPWGAKARSAIADAVSKQSDVLIVGTGLTMVDVVLSLDAAGHEGRIVALSRRGLVPRSHDAAEPSPVEWEDIPSGGVRPLVAWLRKRAHASGWRSAIDALRPHSQKLWESLGGAQQKLFLRHARPWWDVHRHRIAPQVARKLAHLVESKRLEIIAGRLTKVSPESDAIEVEFRKRGEDKATRRSFGYVFNCTGPLSELSRTQDPLLRSLLDQAAIAPDELGIGIAVNGRARVDGSERLWALGALTKGRHWEIIAVPDIRQQAAQVADDIATELGQ